MGQKYQNFRKPQFTTQNDVVLCSSQTKNTRIWGLNKLRLQNTVFQKHPRIQRSIRNIQGDFTRLQKERSISNNNQEYPAEECIVREVSQTQQYIFKYGRKCGIVPLIMKEGIKKRGPIHSIFDLYLLCLECASYPSLHVTLVLNVLSPMTQIGIFITCLKNKKRFLTQPCIMLGSHSQDGKIEYGQNPIEYKLLSFRETANLNDNCDRIAYP